MRVVLAAALAAGSVVLGGTAHADPDNVVQSDIIGDNEQVGNGVVAIATCSAHATPAPGWTVVSTTVSCSINGFASPTVTTPTALSVTAVANATSAPVVVCISATAIFSPTVGSVEVRTDSRCVTTPVGT